MAINEDTTSKASAIKIIKSAMRKLNVLASGETPEADEATDALETLNGMIQSWAIERLMIFTIQRQEFMFQGPFKQVYTVGPGGDMNIPRPPKLPRVGVIYLGNAQQPLELPMDMLTDVGWSNIPVKNIVSTIPLKCWDDQGFPQRNLSIFPIPQQPFGLALYTWTALQTFQNLTTAFSFPPGYIAALVWNLAVRLAPEFGINPLPELVGQLAVESKARVKSSNFTAQEMRVDQALVGRGLSYYDWRVDGPAGPNS